ncbi:MULTISPECIES: exosome complex protein Rrp42 [Archaeoglobus]|uniref:Exosome complex component Rrp42 n=1 Tax=Archaeoglobus profundus (strain DSM 5631 / JCM 9629 / NBRC 100127 / Av18) TaxID=572546 RepID=D2RH04_ARCPA|nr:exosome complex protein Rrp42 [Archaeoglobus profundus]ADB57579.1 3' exoribonuclease [Archaeoglobus profundus DSM 5631]
MSDEILMEVRKDYVLSKLRDGERIDGRAFDEIRPIEIKTGLIKKAEGSAYVKLGNTQVVAGVKMQIGEPFPDTPDQGIIITNAELVPLASPTFEPGPPDENAIELARVVDRGIRHSEAVDLKKLCIEEGEKVWIIFIDIWALDDDGNLMDASALAAIAALLNTTVPAERFEVGDDFPLPVRDLPVAITSLVYDDKILVDPCRDELSVGKNTITITTDQNDNIVSIQKSGPFLLSEKAFEEVLEVSIRKAREVRKLLADV